MGKCVDWPAIFTVTICDDAALRIADIEDNEGGSVIRRWIPCIPTAGWLPAARRLPKCRVDSSLATAALMVVGSMPLAMGGSALLKSTSRCGGDCAASFLPMRVSRWGAVRECCLIALPRPLISTAGAAVSLGRMLWYGGVESEGKGMAGK